MRLFGSERMQNMMETLALTRTRRSTTRSLQAIETPRERSSPATSGP